MSRFLRLPYIPPLPFLLIDFFLGPMYLYVCVLFATAWCHSSMGSLPVVVDLGLCLTLPLVTWPHGCLVVCMQLCSAVLWWLDLILMLTCAVSALCSRWHVAVLAVLFACRLMSLFCLDLQIISTCVCRFGPIYHRFLLSLFTYGFCLLPVYLSLSPPSYISYLSYLFYIS